MIFQIKLEHLYKTVLNLILVWTMNGPNKLDILEAIQLLKFWKNSLETLFKSWASGRKQWSNESFSVESLQKFIERLEEIENIHS